MSQTFSDSKQIGTVSTFAALTNTHFEGEKNALCWQRDLDGDFNEIVNQLTLKENITVIQPEDLFWIFRLDSKSFQLFICENDTKRILNIGF